MKYESIKSKSTNPQPPKGGLSGAIQANPSVISYSSALGKSSDDAASIYAAAPSALSFDTLQQNLAGCLSMIDNEIMKGYVPSLHQCRVLPLDEETANHLAQIQFFRINELVYEENEFSVHKLSTVFHALSNKPCTLVLMIQSTGDNNAFYLGVRSRDPRYSTGTMRQMLEQSLLGLFPGSNTSDFLTEDLNASLNRLHTGCVSSVTCIADYKQEKETLENKDFIQGLEKFIYSMQGKPFTAVCIANNLAHQDLEETRREYERIYTMMSPFANMQYNFALNKSASTSDSDTQGQTNTVSRGSSHGISTTQGASDARSKGTSLSHSKTNTVGENSSTSSGSTRTSGRTDGTNESESTTKTKGKSIGLGVNTGLNLGGFVGTMVNAGVAGFVGAGINTGLNLGAMQGASLTGGLSGSVSRGLTKGSSHSISLSDAISQNLTQGVSSSRSFGSTSGQTESNTATVSTSTGTQRSETEGSSVSDNASHTRALTDTFGDSQSVTLNVQNKSLLNMLKRLEKQMERLDECESIGMWDFAAYFLGESAAEAETAASMYQSLVSGSQSGLEASAVNTWTDPETASAIETYITHFLHPVFLCQMSCENISRLVAVDPTVMASTNELAIQLGLPRKSVKGLPVTKHAVFAQEVLSFRQPESAFPLGRIMHLGKPAQTAVELDLQSLAMHTFVTGATGSGKSNTIYQLLSRLLERKVRFLVIEPAKGEYKHAFGHRDDVTVFGTNPRLAKLLRINPFSFPEEIHVLEHIDRLVEIFNACWPMYAAMPAVLKDAIEAVYRDAGWDLTRSVNCENTFPTFRGLLKELPETIERSHYSADTQSDYVGALVTRVRSLTNGIIGQIFCSDDAIPNKQLFDNNVIIDLSRIGSSETKSLLMGLITLQLQEYRMSQGGINSVLKHVTVLEEAHHLLRRTSSEQSQESSNLQGKSVEMLANAIAELRTYGEGFLIADQSPGLMDLSVIRNTNTKIIMRLPDENDRQLVGKAASLNEEQIKEISRLPKGVAAVSQNDWLEPVLCKMERYDNMASYTFCPDNEPAYFSRLCSAAFDSSVHEVFSVVEREQVIRWIRRQNIDNDTQGLLIKAAENNPLTDEEQIVTAYNLFDGKRLSGLLENAEDEAEGIRNVERRIAQTGSLENPSLAKQICQLILQGVLSQMEGSKLSQRYLAYEAKGGIR